MHGSFPRFASLEHHLEENSFTLNQILEKDNFSYLLRDKATGDSLVIDPGYPAVYSRVANEGLRVTDVFLTHGHSDHTGSVSLFQEKFESRVWAMAGGSKFGSTHKTPADGQEICFGRTRALIRALPGHTTDGAVLQAGNCLFTGDALFIGTFGYAASPEAMQSTYDSLYRVIPSFEQDLLVFPGHDYAVEDLEMVRRALDSCPGLDQALERYRSARRNRGSIARKTDEMIFSSLQDESRWNLAYNLENPQVDKLVAARGFRPGSTHFEKYRAVQLLVNAS